MNITSHRHVLYFPLVSGDSVSFFPKARGVSLAHVPKGAPTIPLFHLVPVVNYTTWSPTDVSSYSQSAFLLVPILRAFDLPCTCVSWLRCALPQLPLGVAQARVDRCGPLAEPPWTQASSRAELPQGAPASARVILTGPLICIPLSSCPGLPSPRHRGARGPALQLLPSRAAQAAGCQLARLRCKQFLFARRMVYLGEVCQARRGPEPPQLGSCLCLTNEEQTGRSPCNYTPCPTE